jgi:hypothetical protein
MIAMNTRSLDQHFRDLPLVMNLLPSTFKFHTIICFALYVGGLVKFVTALRKGHMRYQVKLESVRQDKLSSYAL